MSEKKIHILSTRPVGASLCEAARLKLIILDEVSFIETRTSISNETGTEITRLQGEQTFAVFTSMNAVEAVASRVGKVDWKVFCIGYATRKLVEKYFGKETIVGTADNAGMLAEKIVAREGIQEVHFFCGNQRRDELPAILKSGGITVHELVVYETIEISQDLDKQYDGILFFSPSAVHSFFKSNTPGKSSTLFAIGDTTAEAIRSYSANLIVTANSPGKAQLVNQAIEFFSKKMYV